MVEMPEAALIGVPGIKVGRRPAAQRRSFDRGKFRLQSARYRTGDFVLKTEKILPISNLNLQIKIETDL